MRCAESAGVATKKSSSGIVRPGVGPASHERPRVFVLAAGTRTWYSPRRVDEEVRLLAADGRRLERRVRRVRERRVRRGALDAREDLVPDRVRPAADPAVADQPLLLRAVDHEREVRVGDEAAARELRPGRAVVHEREVPAADVEPAHRHRLRDRPEVRGRAAAVLTGRVDAQRQVRERAPEVDERDAVARAPAVEAAVVDLDLAVDRHVRRGRAQAGQFGVVAHLQLQRLPRAAVDARLEQERVAVRAHLGVDLLRMDRVDRRLDLGHRHARVEDDHVRAEGRRRRRSARPSAAHEREQQQRQSQKRPRPGHGIPLLLDGAPRRRYPVRRQT